MYEILEKIYLQMMTFRTFSKYGDSVFKDLESLLYRLEDGKEELSEDYILNVLVELKKQLDEEFENVCDRGKEILIEIIGIFERHAKGLLGF